MPPTTAEDQAALQARTVEVLALTVQTKRLLAEATEGLRRIRRVAEELRAMPRRPSGLAAGALKRLTDRFGVENAAGEDWGCMTEFTQAGIRTFWIFGFQAALEPDGSFSLPTGDRCFRVVAHA